ncbi:O-antigen ligase family protein [Azospirillum sp. sgz302134]
MSRNSMKSGGSPLLTWLELGFVVLALMMLWDMHLPIGGQVAKDKLLESGADYDRGGDLLKQVSFLGCYLTGGLLLFVRTPARRMLEMTGPWFWLFLLLVVASAGWSYDPMLTVRRSIALSGTVIFGFYLALRFTPRQLMTLMYVACAFGMWGSALTAILIPSVGLDVDRNWMGVFAQKNSLGHVSAFSITLSLALFSQFRAASFGLRTMIAANLAMAFVCLFMAGSATAIVLVLFGLLAYALVLLMRRQPSLRVMTVLASIVVVFGGALFAMLNLELVTQLLGRDATLTGRTTVWAFCVEMIAKSPLVGYGYGVFWEGWESPGAAFWLSSGQYIIHSHNGMLQLLLDLGGVGFLLIMLTLIRTFRLGAVCFSAGESRVPTWLYVYLAMYLVLTITENYFIQANTIFLTFYAAIATQFQVAAWTLRGRRTSRRYIIGLPERMVVQA